ncbi:hypothetical protein [Kribbella sp. NPDC004875]|uniref:hypothetical protein n=1 Tax=Kribbella sp. NPDC004875 TaxID=3364107 RepID=UPI0036A6FB41
MSRRVTHGQSHAALLNDVSAVKVSPNARTRLDAIVVPAARQASALQNVIRLSIKLSVPLVILCSRQAQADQVRARVESVKNFGAQALVIEVPEDYRPPCTAPLTSGREFTEASAGRSSDLSVKRNIGLLLGRLRGWNKILFVDDDISQFNQRDVERLTAYLDRYPVASMVSQYFPDNSVVCHARRLAGFGQDVFVSGAALGVNLKHPDLSFFADIYNEDWFFFARQAADRSLPKIGVVRQEAYEPFEDPGRADREEFGDILAEGLYGLLDKTPNWSFKDQLAAATRKNHWQSFIEERLDTIQTTYKALTQAEFTASPASYRDMENARNSLQIAETRATSITPDLCVDFIEKWHEDEVRWQQMLRRFPSGLSEQDALSELQLTSWLSCGYGQLAGVSGTAGA